MELRRGPLAGLKVIEVGGVGPAPFCAMLLADLGAEVIRVDRKHASESGLPVDRKFEIMFRNRKSIALDLKKPGAVDVIKTIVGTCDILLEGFRPGVMERLGLGPDECLAINPRLVYGRMTGWGQTGPLAKEAGHDINYIALTGALHAIGQKDGPPEIPLNLIGDFGGGAMYLAFGVMCALHEAKSSGKGQVVDASMLDGSVSLMTMVYGLLAAGYWTDQRGSNRLDSGAPYYGVYETADRQYVALGATEASFYRTALEILGITENIPDQHDRTTWETMKQRIADAFKMRTREEWVLAFDNVESCFSPILSLAEAPHHPHNIARGNFYTQDGVIQPSPAPKFSRSEVPTPKPPARVGEHNEEILRQHGFTADAIADLKSAQAI